MPTDIGPLSERVAVRLPTLLSVALAVLVPMILLSPNLFWPYHDAAIFGVIGEGWLQGEFPYRDLWDHKPPGTYAIASLAAAAPGATWPVLWTVSVTAIAMTTLLLRPIVGNGVAVLTAASMSLYPAALGGGQSETFASLPAAAALILATRSPLLAGVCAALAVSISLQLLPLLPALLLLPSRRSVVVAFVGTAAVIVVGLAAAGILLHAYDALVNYSRIYLGSSPTGDPGWHLLLILGPLVPLVIWRMTSHRYGEWTPLRRVAVAWLVLGVLAVALQGRQLGHYITPLAIPAAVLAAPALPRHLWAGVGVAVAALLITATVVDYPQSGPITTEIGEYVRDHTAEEDSILVWGVEANIYLEAGRKVAGRYPYLMPLVTRDYSSATQVQEWVDSLESHPPRMIVDSEAANPHWSGDDFLKPPPPGAAGGRDLDILGPLRAFVTRNYELVATIHDRKIYRLRTPLRTEVAEPTPT